MNKKLKQFAISYNPQIPEAEEKTEDVVAFLEKLGASIMAIGAIHDKDIRQRVKKKEFDALIVLGGDGTMLRASHLCASARMPIVGINLGSFGFLMELQRADWKEFLKLPNGTSHIITFNPSILKDPEHKEKFITLLKEYTENGGTALQINMLAPHILRETQKYSPFSFSHL